jgi:hypothetical protein
MAKGLIAGAIQGLGGAMQHNAQSSIEEKRQTALRKLEHGMAMERQDDQQQFSRGERKAGQEFTSGENATDREFRAGESAADREQRLSLAQMQEAGANSRAAAGRNDWEVVPLEGGGYGRYNPRTNQFENANLPDSARVGDEGDLSDVEKKRFDLLSDDIDAIRERAADEARNLTKDEAEILAGYINDRNAILGSGGSGGSGEQTIPEREGGDTGGTGEGGSGGTDAPDLTYQQIMDGIQQESGQQSVSDVLSDVGLLVSEIKLSEGASSGGLIGPGPRGQGRAKEKGDKARAEAQKLLPTLVEMYNATKNEDERALLRKRIGELGEIGITPAKP